MLTPSEFNEAYSDAELKTELPDSPISSLRDLQFLYGKLYTLATTGGGKYKQFLTPYSARDLVDEDDSLIIVRVDLRNSEIKLAADQPIIVTRYTEDLIEQVAHCKCRSANDIDHSITHQSGKNSEPEKLARYAIERFTKWATDDVVSSVALEHEDGWIIEKLTELGQINDVLENIKNEVIEALGGEKSTALLTIQVQFNTSEGYLWPGEIEVFLEAMQARIRSKLVTKNKASNSSGIATDLVTFKQSRTVGTPVDPLNYNLGKQREKFSGLNIESAWRSHPISESSAIMLMHAEPFIDVCRYSTLGARVYYLPYFQGTPTPEKSKDLYYLLYSVLNEEKDISPIELAYEKADNIFHDDLLRFYVSVIKRHQMSRYDVFGDTMNGHLLYPEELAESHDFITASELFTTNTERPAPLPSHENWDLTIAGEHYIGHISSGLYFEKTFGYRDDDGAVADDPRIDALVAVLAGDTISVETLLSEYVSRIETQRNEDDERRFPQYLVASQFAQLSALADADLGFLSATNEMTESITQPPSFDLPTMDDLEPIPMTDGGVTAVQKLESFIDQTPAITEDQGPVNDERRAAFLLGALVGEVGSYQVYSENRSTTLIDQHSVKSITKTRIKKVAQETIDKTIVYSREANRSITLFEHVVDRLREAIIQTDPDEWSIGTDDLRFYYALGVTYGMNDHPDWDNTNETSEESK